MVSSMNIRKPARLRHTEQYKLLLTPDQARKLRAISKRAGKPASEVVRELIEVAHAAGG